MDPAPPGSTDPWGKVAGAYLRNIVPEFRQIARALTRAAGISAGQRVLDIACGPGTATLEAVTAGAARVTGIDRSPGMVRLAREESAGRPAHYLIGDALGLPFRSGVFDAAISNFGMIFGSSPHQVVAEVARVLRPDGALAFSAWPRIGSIGAYYDTVDRFVTPASGHDPHAWAIPSAALAWLEPAFSHITFQSLQVPFEADSPAEAWRVLNSSTGRVSAAYSAMSPEQQRAFDATMLDFFSTLTQENGAVLWAREAIVIGARKRLR